MQAEKTRKSCGDAWLVYMLRGDEEMNKRLLVQPGLCDGCGICELVCALQHTGQWHPALSRIRIIEDRKYGLQLPLFCAHCVSAPCVNACLMNVITKDKNSGWTVRNEMACIGCHACEIACPFGACFYNFIDEVVANCDFCGGDPACVKYCPQKALTYITVAEGISRKREEVGDAVTGGVRV